MAAHIEARRWPLPRWANLARTAPFWVDPVAAPGPDSLPDRADMVLHRAVHLAIAETPAAGKVHTAADRADSMDDKSGWVALLAARDEHWWLFSSGRWEKRNRPAKNTIASLSNS